MDANSFGSDIFVFKTISNMKLKNEKTQLYSATYVHLSGMFSDGLHFKTDLTSCLTV